MRPCVLSVFSAGAHHQNQIPATLAFGAMHPAAQRFKDDLLLAGVLTLLPAATHKARAQNVGLLVRDLNAQVCSSVESSDCRVQSGYIVVAVAKRICLELDSDI